MKHKPKLDRTMNMAVPLFVSGQTYKISKGSNNYCSHCIYSMCVSVVSVRAFQQWMYECFSSMRESVSLVSARVSQYLSPTRPLIIFKSYTAPHIKYFVMHNTITSSLTTCAGCTICGIYNNGIYMAYNLCIANISFIQITHLPNISLASFLYWYSVVPCLKVG